MSANRNIRRRLRRKIVECRKGLEWLREEAADEDDPFESRELLSLATETEAAADAAEQLLSERG